MKLSPAQRRVLERLAAGEVLWIGGGDFRLSEGSYWFDGLTESNPVTTTAKSLFIRGLIEHKMRSWTRERVTITDKGRAALEEV